MEQIKQKETAAEASEQKEACTDRILECIKSAEMILVGIGREFSPKLPVDIAKGKQDDGNPLAAYQRSRFYEELPSDHEVIQAYNRLHDLIGAKPYFVVTLNTDDLIYRSKLERDLIVAPCGSCAKMQCTDHIVDAKEIRDAVLADENLEHAVCPQCGKPLHFHTVDEPDYLERGYLDQWEKYTKWLQCTLNRKLCILELGVDFYYPQVVRWPFEKTAFYNQKAALLRINSRFPQLTDDLAQRGLRVARNPVSYLNAL